MRTKLNPVGKPGNCRFRFVTATFVFAALAITGCTSQRGSSVQPTGDWTTRPQPQYVQGSGWYLGQSGYGPVYYGPEGHYEIYGPPPPAFPLPPAPGSPKLNPPDR